MNLLLYAPAYTPRLRYICDLIFTELMGIDLSITHDSFSFKNDPGVKINYSSSSFSDSEFHIEPVRLLFENTIAPQTIHCVALEHDLAFFSNNDSNLGFDILAASFYLLSRYEEYLPHTKDMYGRYAHENSLAFKEGFLQLPLINIWVKALASAIQNKFPALTFQPPAFIFTPTYDIDMAYSYKQKGFLRNLGGFVKSPSTERIKVLLGLQKDPFDTYDWLDGLHEKLQLKPLYFFLVAAQNAQFDKNILPNKMAMAQLVKQHANKYTIGIHPSWQSGDDGSLLAQEKKQLELISRQPVTISRQHYIRFSLPNGYRRLLQAGITDDHSMGYGSINGFRASVASPFYWYDLEKEQTTSLRIHPFCFMDANSFYEEKLCADEAFKELMHYYDVCKEANGHLITIWHNNTIGTQKMFKGWGQMYERFLENISS